VGGAISLLATAEYSCQLLKGLLSKSSRAEAGLGAVRIALKYEFTACKSTRIHLLHLLHASSTQPGHNTGAKHHNSKPAIS
jgi:hypothetical protein